MPSDLLQHTPEEVRRSLARRMRELRLILGWKQSTLAARAGISLPTVRRYERSGRTSLENFLRVCHALGRLDEFGPILRVPPAQSIAELEARTTRPTRKRGRT